MIYRAIGVMSGSSLDGLDIAFAEFHENGGNWSYELKASACYPYSKEWIAKLKDAIHLNARDYLLLNTDFGHYIGEKVNHFIAENNLQYQVSMISSHGHTSFHIPDKKMTGQLGDGAAIAAVTGLPVITDLRAMDIAFGGQGAPIVPIGEKLLLKGFDYYLNLGGIANLSHYGEKYVAFDICPANRVLNLLATELGKEYDDEGKIASSGRLNAELLAQLDQLDYYQKPFPKSLANDFGTDVIYPMIKKTGIDIPDALNTYVAHIVGQIHGAVDGFRKNSTVTERQKLLATGGGAFNSYLVGQLRQKLNTPDVELVIPEPSLINNKEALIMAFIGVLRWRQEVNVMASVTGAAKDSIGGALWCGQVD